MCYKSLFLILTKHTLNREIQQVKNILQKALISSPCTKQFYRLVPAILIPILRVGLFLLSAEAQAINHGSINQRLGVQSAGININIDQRVYRFPEVIRPRRWGNAG
ncbi:MAG: hypothetical protein ACK2U3_12225 [Anaerolineales bacterium]